MRISTARGTSVSTCGVMARTVRCPVGGGDRGNLAREGDTDEKRWAADLRLAASGRPEAKCPIWHASLRCAPTDRTLTDAEVARGCGGDRGVDGVG